MANGKPQQRKHSAGSVRYYQIQIFAKLYMYSRYYKPSTHTNTFQGTLCVSHSNDLLFTVQTTTYTRIVARAPFTVQRRFIQDHQPNRFKRFLRPQQPYILFLIVFSLLYSWSVRIFFYVLCQHPRNTRSFRDVEDYLIQAKNM